MGLRAVRPSSPIAAIAVLLTTAALLSIGMASSARAAGPEWTLEMTHSAPNPGEPFVRGPEKANSWVTSLVNTGDANLDGGTITLTDTLPAGVKLLSTGAEWACTSPEEVNGGAPLVCTELYPSMAEPGQGFTPFVVTVEGLPGPETTITNTLTVTGGGAPEATVSDVTPIVDLLPFHAKTFTAKSTDSEGNLYAIAGGHPFQTLNRWTFPVFPDEQMRNASVTLPPGYFGNPAAAPRCPIGQIGAFSSNCPAGSQIGQAGVGLFGFYNEFTTPIFNVVPDKGFPAQFVLNVFGTQISLYVVPLPRTEKYGLTIGATNAGRVDIKSFSATFFGVPSQHGQGTSGSPFLTNPVDCAESNPSWGLILDTWENPGIVLPSSLPDQSDPAWITATEPTPPVTGCENPALASQFHPSIEVTPAQEGPGPQADQPTGLKVGLNFPQSNDPTDLSTVFDPSVPQSPEPKDITVKLPAGVSVSPASADGLQGCSDLADDPAGDQVHYDNTNPVDCPDASKIGTALTNTPLLASRDPVDDSVTGPEPIHGDVYLIKPHAGDLGQGGDRDGTFRILIQLESARYGLNFKLPGVVTADKSTGQLTATFADNPQLPVSKLELDLKSGPRAPLASPPTCGDFITTSHMVPWSTPGTPDATPAANFAIAAGPNGTSCPADAAGRPFSPALKAGSGSANAGQASPFVLSLHRQDGEQEMSSINAKLPKGFSAKLAGIPYCSDAAIAAASGESGAAEQVGSSCPAASRVGTIDVGAGAGPAPFYAKGTAYLAGPYKGAPLSIVFITPAVAGPFDLGNVVVRAATFIDPESAQVTVKADPLPTVLDGVPLRIRSIVARIDRSGFALNPTNCELGSVDVTVGALSGASSSPSSAYRVDGCEGLGFQPKLTIQLLGGRKATKRRQHPALTAVLQERPGDANIAATTVTLPPNELLDNSHIGTVCARALLAADACPAASIYGHASASSPLIDQPLAGNVYLVPGAGKLPDLLADLKGQIDVRVRGAISASKQGGLRAAFTSLPDVPVTKFTLNMEGGKKGLLINSESLCKADNRNAILNMTAQSGRTFNVKKLQLQASCPRQSKKHGSRSR